MPDDDIETIELPCPECGRVFEGPAGGRGNARWRLQSHLRATHGIAGDDVPPKAAKNGDGGAAGPSGAPHVDLNLGFAGKPKADPALEAVRQRAEQVVSVAAILLVLLAHRESLDDPPKPLELDAADLERGKAQWADAVSGVAVHEKWLRDLCQGGEGSERVMAWIKLAAATLGLTLPILLRHEALPPAIAAVFSQVAAQMPDAPASGPRLQPVA